MRAEESMRSGGRGGVLCCVGVLCGCGIGLGRVGLGRVGLGRVSRVELGGVVKEMAG